MTYIFFIRENICDLILKRHIYTFYISFVCRLIFNANINVTYHKTICRLQPTTSHHTVQGFQSSHVYRRRAFPTFNPSTWRYVYVHFEWPYYSKTFTCMTHSKSETLKGPGLPWHYIPGPIRLKMGLCADTRCLQGASCVIISKLLISMCDNFKVAHFNIHVQFLF